MCRLPCHVILFASYMRCAVGCVRRGGSGGGSGGCGCGGGAWL